MVTPCFLAPSNAATRSTSDRRRESTRWTTMKASQREKKITPIQYPKEVTNWTNFCISSFCSSFSFFLLILLIQRNDFSVRYSTADSYTQEPCRIPRRGLNFSSVADTTRTQYVIHANAPRVCRAENELVTWYASVFELQGLKEPRIVARSWKCPLIL